jgi:hypothetical protein
MEKVNQKEMDVRVRRLVSYAKKNGWLKVAAFTGYDDVAPCKLWATRRSIPGYVWVKLEKLLNGDVDVEIQIK